MQLMAETALSVDLVTLWVIPDLLHNVSISIDTTSQCMGFFELSGDEIEEGKSSLGGIFIKE